MPKEHNYSHYTHIKVFQIDTVANIDALVHSPFIIVPLRYYGEELKSRDGNVIKEYFWKHGACSYGEKKMEKARKKAERRKNRKKEGTKG